MRKDVNDMFEIRLLRQILLKKNEKNEKEMIIIQVRCI